MNYYLMTKHRTFKNAKTASSGIPEGPQSSIFLMVACHCCLLFLLSTHSVTPSATDDTLALKASRGCEGKLTWLNSNEKLLPLFPLVAVLDVSGFVSMLHKIT